jgi:hypothetical protein
MLDTQTISDAELAEMLSRDVMCQGNNFDGKHVPCPKNAAAVVKWRSRGCQCTIPDLPGHRPAKFKCLSCFMAWVKYRIRKFGMAKRVRCPVCGDLQPAPFGRNDYVPL